MATSWLTLFTNNNMDTANEDLSERLTQPVATLAHPIACIEETDDWPLRNLPNSSHSTNRSTLNYLMRLTV